MSRNASSSPLRGSLSLRWGRFATCAALPPTVALDEPLRLFDLNKTPAGVDVCFDETEPAVVAARRRVPELALSSQDGDGEDADDELSERAWDSGAWAASRKLQPPTNSLTPYTCVAQRTNATSLPMELKGASAASATAAVFAADTAASAAAAPDASAAAAPLPTPAAAAPPAAPPTFTKTTATVATAGGSTGAALTSAACRRMGLLASGAALTAAFEDCARFSSWCEATVDARITAAPPTAGEALSAAVAAPSAAAVRVQRNIASTSPNSCADGRVQSQASIAAALFAMSSVAAAANASEGSPNAVAADASSDSLQHGKLSTVRCAGAGACSNPEAQGHALFRAKHCGSATPKHLLQRDRINSLLRCAAAAPTKFNAATSSCVADIAPCTPSAELPCFATPSFLPGNGLCHSADPPFPSVPSAPTSRASQNRTDHKEVLAMLHSKAEHFSLPLVQANNGCGDAAEVLQRSEPPKDGGHTGCTDALRPHCPPGCIDGYRCRECGKIFKSAQALGGHTAAHVKHRRSNFHFRLGHYAQNRPLIESSRSSRTEPVETPECRATKDKDSMHFSNISGLLYGSSKCLAAPDTSKGSNAPTVQDKFVRSTGVETRSSWLTADVLYFPAASSRQRHENRDASSAPGSGSSSQDSRRRQPSAQHASQQEGSRVPRRHCLQTSVHVSEGIGTLCWQRHTLSGKSTAAATEPAIVTDTTTIYISHAYLLIPHPHSTKGRASCSASAVQPCNPDSHAANSSVAPTPMAAAVGPLSPSALTAAARAFMDQQDGDEERPSKRRMRAKSSSPASAEIWKHSGQQTTESHAALGAAATPHGLAHQTRPRSSCHFSPTSQTVLPVAGIHQECLDGMLKCNSRQLVINRPGLQLPTPEVRDSTPGLDFNLELREAAEHDKQILQF